MTSIKAHAAGIGGGVGAALAELLGAFVPQMADHQGAAAVLLAAVVGWTTTYFAPSNK